MKSSKLCWLFDSLRRTWSSGKNWWRSLWG